MPTLLMYNRGKWSRHPLPSDGCVQVRVDAASEIQIESAHAAPFAPDAIGVLMTCPNGHPYHLSVPGTPVYYNAEPHPMTPVHRLRDRDRLTYYVAGGPSLSLWFVRQDGSACQQYDGTPPGQVCGYCGMAFALGEETVTCDGCGESLHADCLAHGGGRCPRCGLNLASNDDLWLPEGFPDETEEADDGWE